MSFLSSLVDFGKSVFTSGVASSIAKTVLLGFAINKLNTNVTRENNSGTNNIDRGVRLQVSPDAQEKIPVLYGEGYFGGNIFDARQVNNNETMWFALALCEKTGSKLSGGSSSYNFKNVYVNNQRIVFKSDGITVDYAVDRQGVIDRSGEGLIKVYLYAGGPGAGVIPDGYSGTVPNATSIFPNWSSGTHELEDLVFAVIRIDYNRDRGITSLGDWLFDVDNSMKQPGDVLFDYLTNDTYGAGISANDIDTASFTELNNYSAESVPYIQPGVGTVNLPNRYQINGLLDTSQTVLTNAENIASATASWLSFDVHSGKWSVIINRETAVSASFNDDNILGNINLGSTGLTDLYNAVKSEFPNRDIRDSGDFVKIALQPADKNPNEPSNTLNLTYDIINEQVQAEILSFIELKQSRVDLVIEFETDYSYVSLRAGDVIEVTNNRYDFVNKPFRIISVTERQGDGAALSLQITALEYDADVYDFSDITRFIRTDEDGLITLGSIGEPSVPQVTKFESASRPRIEVSTLTPSGIVEGLEYWITFDVNITNDNQRNYRLFATQRPSTQNVYPPNTAVTIEYDNLNASNFFIKIRGFNKATVGPFSDPSGLVEFNPTQTTDAITPDTDIQDELGGLATALGVISLLKLLDDLFNLATGGGLFERIFDIFKDETGEDILEEAKEGKLGKAITIQDDGTIVTETVSSINFGTGLEVVDDGDGAITVNVTGVPQQVTQQNLGNFVSISCPDDVTYGESLSFGIQLVYLDCDKILQIPYTITGDVTTDDIDVPLSGNVTVEISNGAIQTTNFEINTIDNDQQECKTLIFTVGCSSCEVEICPVILEPGPDLPCLLVVTETLPADKNSWDITCGLAPPLVPHTGPYYVRFAVDEFNSAEKPYVADFEKGSGNFYLYESDGTLADTVAAGSVDIFGNLVSIPFANRTLGTDYYVTWDAGVVEYCGCVAQPVDDPTTWNFTVAPYAIDPYVTGMIGGIQPFDPFEPEVPSYDSLTVTSVSAGSDTPGCTVTQISISFSEEIQAGSGAITVTKLSSNTVVLTSNISQATIISNTAVFTYSSGTFEPGETFQIDVPEGIVTSSRDPVTVGVCGVFETFQPDDTVNLPAGGRFTAPEALQLIDYNLCADPFDNDNNSNINIRSNIELVFNKSFTVATGSAPIELYEDGSLKQTFDLRDTYAEDQIGEIFQQGSFTIRLNPTEIMKPGSSYHVEIPAEIIFDPECEVFLDAITDSNTISWQTDSIQISQIDSFDPDEQQDITQPVFNLELDRPIEAGTGNIEVVDGDGNVIGTIPANSPAIQIQS